MVQSDYGVEYHSLHNFLQNYGITHRVSCPHTHQQNGVVERKHCHVVETGPSFTVSCQGSTSILG